MSRTLTAPLRLLPAFLIIGAQRCGTTSLFEQLCRHPLIARALRAEIHFFDSGFGLGSTWYRAQFPTRFGARVNGRGRAGRVICGEKSPYYLLHPLAPARIAATLPEIKLIALLRNPVDRALSHFWLQVRRGHELLQLEDALDREPERLRGERERIVADEGYQSVNHRRYSYLARGVYVDQLLAFHAHFSVHQILVISSEELHADPDAGVRRVLRFLGLPELHLGSYERRNRADYPAAGAVTRARLVAYFEPYNARLYDVLGRSFDWDK